MRDQPDIGLERCQRVPPTELFAHRFNPQRHQAVEDRFCSCPREPYQSCTVRCFFCLKEVVQPEDVCQCNECLHRTEVINTSSFHDQGDHLWRSRTKGIPHKSSAFVMKNFKAHGVQEFHQLHQVLRRLEGVLLDLELCL